MKIANSLTESSSRTLKPLVVKRLIGGLERCGIGARMTDLQIIEKWFRLSGCFENRTAIIAALYWLPQIFLPTVPLWTPLECSDFDDLATASLLARACGPSDTSSSCAIHESKNDFRTLRRSIGSNDFLAAILLGVCRVWGYTFWGLIFTGNFMWCIFWPKSLLPELKLHFPFHYWSLGQTSRSSMRVFVWQDRWAFDLVEQNSDRGWIASAIAGDIGFAAAWPDELPAGCSERKNMRS